MYENTIKDIVARCGGYREKDVLQNPHTIEKSGTWNSEHMVLNINEIETDEDGHKDGFQVDLITRSICG